MVDFGYRLIREGSDTILAVDTRSVSKASGLTLVVVSGLIGLFFLLIAFTSQHDSVLGTAIFLASAACAVATLYGIRKIVTRRVIFTPDLLMVEGDGARQSFVMGLVEGFASSGHTLRMKYGYEQVTVLRRIPDADRVKARVNRVFEEYRRRN